MKMLYSFPITCSRFRYCLTIALFVFFAFLLNKFYNYFAPTINLDLQRFLKNRFEIIDSFVGNYSENETEIPVGFKLSNFGGHPIKILGSTTSCSCMILDQLPSVIEPSGALVVSGIVQRKLGNKMPVLTGYIIIFTDQPGRSEVKLTYKLVLKEGELKGGE
jgi:hypothetical protein